MMKDDDRKFEEEADWELDFGFLVSEKRNQSVLTAGFIVRNC
jgi:hypothetical protein